MKVSTGAIIMNLSQIIRNFFLLFFIGIQGFSSAFAIDRDMSWSVAKNDYLNSQTEIEKINAAYSVAEQYSISETTSEKNFIAQVESDLSDLLEQSNDSEIQLKASKALSFLRIKTSTMLVRKREMTSGMGTDRQPSSIEMQKPYGRAVASFTENTSVHDSTTSSRYYFITHYGGYCLAGLALLLVMWLSFKYKY